MKKKITTAPNRKTVAIPYLRVSSDRQTKEGHGLESQEHRCREYAVNKGYKVGPVFRDSYTGGGDFTQRPAMMELIKYIEDRPHIEFIVIFDDIKRLARDHIAHWRLRELFNRLDVTLESPNFVFGETEEAWLNEGISALFSDYERRTNKRQVKQKMMARLESGYWTFNPNMPGYQRGTTEGRDWVLVRKEPEASIIQEALEGYASGRFLDQVDVQAFLERKDFLGKGKQKKIYLSQVERLLNKIVYAGYIEYPKWEIERRRGKHAGLISIETYERIQEKLNGKKRVRIRKDYNSDFPLRSHVKCSGCGRMITGGWTTGRSKKYPYYRCTNKECEFGNVSIDRSQIEGDFESLLRSLKPKNDLVELTKAILKDLYKQKHSEFKKGQSKQKRKTEDLEREIEALMDRISKTQVPAMIQRYEEKIGLLADEKIRLESEVGQGDTFEISFGTATDEVFNILKNPINKWHSDDLEDKKQVIKMVFNGYPAYNKNCGFGTAELSCVIRLFERIRTTNSRDVEMWRFELQSELMCRE